eukprot:COSAG01_NODE_433_length_17113_cov_23.009757_3_plen_285_part_00
MWARAAAAGTRREAQHRGRCTTAAMRRLHPAALPPPLLLLLLLRPHVAAAPTSVNCPGEHRVCVGDGSLAVTVGASGIVHLQAASRLHDWPSNYTLSGGAKTLLGGGSLSPVACATSGVAVVRDVAPGKTVSLTQRWSCADDDGGAAKAEPEAKQVPRASVVVTVVDTFSGGANTIELTTTITTDSFGAFSTRLGSGLHFIAGGDAGQMSGMWLPWGKGCVQNAGSHVGMCLAGGTPWSSALSPEPLPTAPKHFRYGATGKGSADAFILPLVAILDPTQVMEAP